MVFASNMFKRCSQEGLLVFLGSLPDLSLYILLEVLEVYMVEPLITSCGNNFVC